MLAEAQTLASLRHPCIVALFGILQDEVLHCQNRQINRRTVMRVLSTTTRFCWDSDVSGSSYAFVLWSVFLTASP